MNRSTRIRQSSHDQDWEDLSADFRVRPDTIYLNHGSFGIPINQVRYARRQFIDRLDENPMDFFLRQLESHFETALKPLAALVGTSVDYLVFMENATYAMNVVAGSFPLEPGDEVLLSDHEYGPVYKIWETQCQRMGATMVTVNLPTVFETQEEVVAALVAGVTEKTKLLVISHITSPTALILPIQDICTAFRQAGIAVCVDGPHAPAQIELRIDELGCDFYTASCHKWLCGTLGSGFLYAHPRWQSHVQPIVTSWGRLPPAEPKSWREKFIWLGTNDPSSFLTLPVAIEYLNQLGMEAFRQRSYWLARYAESALCEMFQTEPLGRRGLGWYGSMAHVPLPAGDWSGLQRTLREEQGIEVMIDRFANRSFVRVSCHLYNNQMQIDTLVKALFRHCGLASVGR